MSEVDKKVNALVEKINEELSSLGSETRIKLGVFTTEDTGEKYSSVEVKMGRASYLAYSSPNTVGVKTFLQGVLVSLNLISGNYRLKPMNEISRRMIPMSIIPALIIATERSRTEYGSGLRKRSEKVDPRKCARFEFLRNKFR